jgi:hypothetical protein
MIARTLLTGVMVFTLFQMAAPASAVPQSPPPLRIAPALDALSLNQGESWGVNIVVSYSAGYNGVVELDVFEVGHARSVLGGRSDPARIWAQVRPSRIHGSCRVRLEVHAGLHVPLGVYHLMITAKFAGGTVTRLIAISVERPGSESWHAPGKPL